MNSYCCEVSFPHDLDYGNFCKVDQRITNYPIEIIDERLLRLLKDLDITILHSEVFFTPPNSDLDIHIDVGSVGNLTKLNVCISSNQSFMNWYDVISESTNNEARSTQIGTPYISIDRQCARLIHTQCINGTFIVNAGIPHDSTNYTAENRWTLSMVLWDDINHRHLQFEEALIRLKQYYQE